MKNLLSTLIIALLLASCSTSTNNDNPSQIGTWHIDTQTHATWQGMTDKSTSILMATASENDTTAKPDTTYFYSNDKIQATLSKSRYNKYVGDIQLNIHQDDISGRKLFDHYDDILIKNIDNSFKPVGSRGTLLTPSSYTLQIQLDFDCTVPTQNKDLLLAITKYQVDSVSTPPDTLAYYHLSTEGMYSTAKYLKGCH